MLRISAHLEALDEVFTVEWESAMTALRLKVFLWILFVFMGATAFAKGRALVVISELDHRGVKELSVLYRQLETLAWKIPQESLLLSQTYQSMHHLKNQKATAQGSIDFIAQLIKKKSVEVVDVVLAVHGLPGKLAFYDQTVSVSDWAQALKEGVKREGHPLGLGEETSKLGLLYNLSCYGESHIPSFLDAGFKVAIGSRKVNANSELEYPWVLHSLAMGRTVASSFHRPNSSDWLQLADGPIVWLGKKQDSFLKDTDSYKVIGGQSNYRIRKPLWRP